MYRVLVVDDEKLERDGIRFLLSMEEGEWEIYEAANGKLALNELRKHPVDLMLTDIKMPHMDGLELSKKAREEYPDLEIIIFSGYGDFAFAQEAIRYGVTDYVLKPVDPDRFHDTIQKIQKEIASRKNKEQQSIKEKSFLQQYFLLGYIYSGDQERLKKAEGIVDFSVWEQWHCAILIESDEAFFDSASDEVPLEIREELRRSFFYLNLNGRQSLLLFKDVYCDYVLVAKNVYNLLKRLHPVRFHLAVSRRFDGYQELPEIMEQLEQQMEEKFYHPDIHVYTSEEDEEKNTGEEEQDSRLMEKISEDISRKDVKQLWSHFRSLASKYQSNTQFSAMYVKFVFSNVIRELFQENRFAGEHRLDLEVEILEGIQTLNRQGSTIIYTSHYMEEVEQICTRIAIMDHGRVIAQGTKEELKQMIKTGEIITVEAIALEEKNLQDIRTLDHVFDVQYEKQVLVVRCTDARHNLIRLLNYLQSQDISFGRVFSELPTLNDVFLEITGKQLRD